MNNISFFIPVRYEEPKTVLQKIQEKIDDYFYLGGRSAYVISDKLRGNCREVTIKEGGQSKTKQVVLGAIKIISYITVVLPLIMLAAKAIFRANYTFYVTPAVKKETHTDKIPEDETATGTLPPHIAPPSQDTKNESRVSELIDRFTKAWNIDKKTFDLPPTSFDVKSFSNHLLRHAEQFKKEDVTDNEHFGYIDKVDLDPSQNPVIYVRADLHGDLKSLLENIRSLQAEGLLDQNFKCKPGVHLIFLGDYCDRGNYGVLILQLLMEFREENPAQVHLIRGNHEDLKINEAFGSTDRNLMAILSDAVAANALKRFYETMSLTTYFAVNQGESREYVQWTHGLFEPTMDPALLLDQTASVTHLPVPKRRKLSERIRTLANSSSPLSQAAQRIAALVQASGHLEPDLTAYNWGDVDSQTITGSLGSRRYRLSSQDIRHYLDLSSEQHRVKMLFRGHQHKFQHLMHEDKVLVTTLPVGMDCPGYQSFDQPDRAYIIKPEIQVENWRKRAILRAKGRARTDEITAEHPLTSAAV